MSRLAEGRVIISTARNVDVNTEYSEVLAWGCEGGTEEEPRTCVIGVSPTSSMSW